MDFAVSLVGNGSGCCQWFQNGAVDILEGMTDQFKWGFIGWIETVGKSAADLGRLGDDGVQQRVLGRCPDGSLFSRQVGQSRFVGFFLEIGKDGRDLGFFSPGLSAVLNLKVPVFYRI